MYHLLYKKIENNEKVYMKRKKRFITLLEVMIVILIIGIISGVLGYNMKGSLDEGKAFKSEMGSKQVHDLLILRMTQSEDNLEEILKHPTQYLEGGFVDQPRNLLKDGWNESFVLHSIEKSNGEQDFVVYSRNWHQFLKNKKRLSEKDMQSKYPWAFYFEGNFLDEEQEA